MTGCAAWSSRAAGKRRVPARIHVIGAGLAGLSAALGLVAIPGVEVTIWEATGRAGGRCWSFHDRQLDRLIDNGNHLVLSGNTAVLDHCRRIGSIDRLRIAQEAALPFVDLSDGSRWTVRVPEGPRDALTGGVGLPRGVGIGTLFDAARLMAAGHGRTVADVIRPDGAARTRLWEPLTLAILNAPPEVAAARPLAAVLRQTVLRGAAACRPVTMPDGLGPTLIEPALATLAKAGCVPRYRSPLRGLRKQGGRIAALAFDHAEVALGPDDRVILAVPAPAAGRLLDLPAPGPGQAILNAHFRVSAKPPDGPLLGVLSGLVQWIFVRGDVVSVTVSAADHVDMRDPEAILATLWSETAAALGLEGPPVAQRLLRETAATFSPVPADLARRLQPQHGNLHIAGDHAAPPLPSTIEGALASGRAAAQSVLAAIN